MRFIVLLMLIFASKPLMMDLNNYDAYNDSNAALEELLDSLHLEDSIQDKAYCAFFAGGGAWMIATDNYNSYTVYYSNHLSKESSFEIISLSKNDNDMLQMFSLLNQPYNIEDISIEDNYHPFCYYFKACDKTRHKVFKWNQSTKFINTEYHNPEDIFLPICMSILFPQLY
ncbi:MAG: hypothetical protein PUE80_02830 [bacterium]|nr:hypothetical protein [bacterium]